MDRNLIMSTRGLAPALLVVTLTVVGCSHSGKDEETVAEGIIFSVEYLREGGGTSGFTRVNRIEAVPGRNGSWNVHALGRLTRDFLFITRPGLAGPEVIPVHRLVSVKFGDGGIEKVAERLQQSGG